MSAQKNLAVKKKGVELRTADLNTVEQELKRDTDDLKSAKDRLLAAERVHDTLVPQCVDRGMTFEGRAKARLEEIKSLKEALTLLNNI